MDKNNYYMLTKYITLCTYTYIHLSLFHYIEFSTTRLLGTIRFPFPASLPVEETQKACLLLLIQFRVLRTRTCVSREDEHLWIGKIFSWTNSKEGKYWMEWILGWLCSATLFLFSFLFAEYKLPSKRAYNKSACVPIRHV